MPTRFKELGTPCETVQARYPELRLDCSSFSSFIETEGEYSNVKIGAYDTPYPTISRLVSEMEARRDLSEKYERIKILEFEMKL